MKHEDLQEQIAIKLSDNITWIDTLCANCSLGHYGVEDWDVSIDPVTIMVKMPEKEFLFKDAEFHFTIRIGASDTNNSVGQSYTRIASGKGKFERSGGTVTDISSVEIDFDFDLTAGGEITRI